MQIIKMPRFKNSVVCFTNVLMQLSLLLAPPQFRARKNPKKLSF